MDIEIVFQSIYKGHIWWCIARPFNLDERQYFYWNVLTFQNNFFFNFSNAEVKRIRLPRVGKIASRNRDAKIAFQYFIQMNFVPAPTQPNRLHSKLKQSGLLKPAEKCVVFISVILSPRTCRLFVAFNLKRNHYEISSNNEISLSKLHSRQVLLMTIESHKIAKETHTHTYGASAEVAATTNADCSGANGWRDSFEHVNGNSNTLISQTKANIKQLRTRGRLFLSTSLCVKPLTWLSFYLV